ncbi:MAG TPA: response regulator [Dissulfurispiraceae bacterium]|nr:response regulator [Dissulfurispiraceae bacterium]
MRILIAEDDFISQRIMREILGEFGSCDIAVSGTEVIREFRSSLDNCRPYQAIFLDIMMPHINGIEALRQIRAVEETMNGSLQSAVKVIMTTALDDPKTAAGACYEGGADAYLVKPVTRHKLLGELKKVGLL